MENLNIAANANYGKKISIRFTKQFKKIYTKYNLRNEKYVQNIDEWTVLTGIIYFRLTFTLCKCNSWLRLRFSSSTFLVSRFLISEDALFATLSSSASFSSSLLKLSKTISLLCDWNKIYFRTTLFWKISDNKSMKVR